MKQINEFLSLSIDLATRTFRCAKIAAHREQNRKKKGTRRIAGKREKKIVN
jgi:hypothetical protein